MKFTTEIRALRRKGIGASEAGAVLGLSPFATPADVWMQKVGLSEGPDETPAMEWGGRLESAVIGAYAEKMGVTAHPSAPMVWHPSGLPVFASPDAFVREAWRAVVDAKTTTSDEGWGAAGTDEVPESILVQTVVQMACLDVGRADVAMLNLARRDFRIYHIIRDLELEAMVLDRLAAFWRDYVVTQTAPAATAAVTFARFPKDNGVLVPADAGALSLLAELRRLGDEKKGIEAAETLVADALKATIGEASGLAGANGKPLVTWKADAAGKKSVDWEAAARAAGATPEVIAAHTQTKQGARRFLPKWKEI